MSIRFSFLLTTIRRESKSDFFLKRGSFLSETEICLIGLGISGCLQEGSPYLFHMDSVWVNSRAVRAFISIPVLQPGGVPRFLEKPRVHHGTKVGEEWMVI